MAKFKLGIIVGSNRRESINRKLAQALARLGGDQFEAKFIQIDDLPIYNQDHENPVPAPVVRFKSEVEAADAMLFVTPEHSRSIPAVLKNAIDWGARPWGKNSWPGKPAAVTGTSGGVISTAVAQQHLRAVLGDLGLSGHGRRSLYSVQARIDRRARQRHRRDRAHVPQDLHRPVRRPLPRTLRAGTRASRRPNDERTNVMSIRPVKSIVQSKPTIEGAGVKLRRAFGFGETAETDPFLLLDDFRNDRPARLSRRLSVASASRHRDHHLRARTAPSSTATASATAARSAPATCNG